MAREARPDAQPRWPAARRSAFADAIVVDDAGEPLGYTPVGRRTGRQRGARSHRRRLRIRPAARSTGRGTGAARSSLRRPHEWALPVPELQPPRARRRLPHDAWLALRASAAAPVAVVREPLHVVPQARPAGHRAAGPIEAAASRADWDDPSVARAEAEWIETVLDTPVAAPSSARDARRRRRGQRASALRRRLTRQARERPAGLRAPASRPAMGCGRAPTVGTARGRDQDPENWRMSRSSCR